MQEISVADYGALPNTGNNYNAFVALSDYINSVGGNVKVIFPPGQYYIRPPYLDIDPDQIIAGPYQYDVFSLFNCSTVLFQGASGVNIKLMDDVPFGIKPDTPGDASVHIGSLFRFTDCTYITISKITANGNMANMHLLDNYGEGANPYEREHEGIFILNSNNIRVLNCNFDNFGRDALHILQDPDFDLETKDCYFSNCNFNWSGRNGISMTAGDNMTFISCNAVNNSKGIIKTNPGSALDIEPERGALCTNSKFVRCVFRNNAGYSVVSGSAEEAYNITFDRCLIYNYYNLALLCSAPYHSFKNCNFIGTVLLTAADFSLGSSPYFEDCIFKDAVTNYPHSHSNYIISLGDYNMFVNCSFYATESTICYSEGGHARFDNCVFYSSFTTDTGYGDNCFLISETEFNNCVFSRDNNFPDYLSTLEDPLRDITLNNCTFQNNF